MSMTTVQVEPKVESDTVSRSQMILAHVRDLSDLTKPRITAMVLITVVFAYFVASNGSPNIFLLLHVLIGTLLVAASSGAFNQWLEAASDSQMDRTRNRPLPAGRMSAAEVVLFGGITLVAGMTYLILTVGWHPAGWALATWIVYVCIYTPMKTRSHWNTLVGAISGALPILIGWSAAELPFGWGIAGMLTLLFIWQFPHFLAIAWIYRHQYGAAGLEMLTTTDPTGKSAGKVAIVGAIAVWACSLLPLFSGPSSPLVITIYASFATLLGWYQLRPAWQFFKQQTDRTAKRLLLASVVYLPLVLGIMAIHAAL